jgi:hypothetical protein
LACKVARYARKSDEDYAEATFTFLDDEEPESDDAA